MVKVSLLLTIICFSVGVLSAVDTESFGTYYRLFGPQSLWNSRPVNPVFNNDTRVRVQLSINAGWAPTIQGGAYSTGIFLAKASDPAVTVYGRTSKGINDVDGYMYLPSVTIPHWPANSVPATGEDGHLDIFDETTGRIHSFWQLSKPNDKWIAEQYAWSNAKADGYGWGDAAHYYQGARAAGVATSAGIIRKHEAIDSKPMFYHALAMSLAHNSLGFAPGYVYPATNADSGYATQNSGYIPEGGLLMLPSTYNTSVHNKYPNLKKVAETLKTYGAYVVDRNTATPYAIYVENGASFKFTNLSWDNTLVGQFQNIRAALRLVVNADKYLDGNGKTLPPRYNVSMLSMRQTLSWYAQYGNAKVRYDTWTQSLTYDGDNTQASSHTITNSLGYNKVEWGKLVVDKTYRFDVTATGQIGQPGLIIQLLVAGNVVTQSPVLSNGQSFSFKHVAGGYLFLIARKPIGGPGSVRGNLYSTETSYAPPTSSKSIFGPRSVKSIESETKF